MTKRVCPSDFEFTTDHSSLFVNISEAIRTAKQFNQNTTKTTCTIGYNAPDSCSPLSVQFIQRSKHAVRDLCFVDLADVQRGTVNTLRLRQNGRLFPDDIFKCIFLNENVWIPIEISLKFVPKGPINNTPTLVLIMA